MIHPAVEIGHEYHVIELVSIPKDLRECLEEWFGPEYNRWFLWHNKIYFKNERDYFWFELRT